MCISFEKAQYSVININPLLKKNTMEVSISKGDP